MYKVYGWLRGHPLFVDCLLALALLGLSAGEWAEHVAFIAVSATLAAAVVPRRRYPVVAFAVAATIAAAQLTVGVEPSNHTEPVHFLEPSMTDMAVVVLLYTLAAYRSRRESVPGLAICLLGITAALARWAPAHDPINLEGIFIAGAALYGITLAAWVLGDSMAYRRAYNAALEERATRLEAERDAQAQIAAAAERARIAREIHDVIAHNVSVMVVQADGASYAFDRDPERSRQALSAISGTGRQALAELRHMLGILRSGDDQAQFAPLPGIGQLADLIDQARSAGLPVSFAVEGNPRPVADGPALAAYRVVQESLTNTRKHAGPGATAAVTLRFDNDALRLRVVDSGPGGTLGAGSTLGAAGGMDGPDGTGVLDGESGALGADSACDAGRTPGADAALGAASAGPASAGPASAGADARGALDTGHGLIGMRERAALYGGTVQAGPRPDGGFEVTAVLPLDTVRSAA